MRVSEQPPTTYRDPSWLLLCIHVRHREKMVNPPRAPCVRPSHPCLKHQRTSVQKHPLHLRRCCFFQLSSVCSSFLAHCWHRSKSNQQQNHIHGLVASRVLHLTQFFQITYNSVNWWYFFLIAISSVYSIDAVTWLFDDFTWERRRWRQSLGTFFR